MSNGLEGLPKLRPEQWRIIYFWWTAFSYFMQGFGVAWLLWGLGLIHWAYKTQDVSEVSNVVVMLLALVLVIPSAALLFGGWGFRRWVQKRAANNNRVAGAESDAVS